MILFLIPACTAANNMKACAASCQYGMLAYVDSTPLTCICNQSPPTPAPAASQSK